MNPAPASGKYSLIQSLESRTLLSGFPPVSDPLGFSVQAVSTSTVKLKWIDKSVNETGFAIERSTDMLNFTLVIVTGPDAVTWTDTGLDPDTQYTYRMYAFTNSDTSNFTPTRTVVTPASSFAERDAQGTLFLHANTGVDVITVTDTTVVGVPSIVVDVNGDEATFSKVGQPIHGITVVTSNNDHTILLDDNQALTLKGNAQTNDIVGISADDDFFHVKINGSFTSFSRSLISRFTINTYVGDDRISISNTVGAVNINGGDGNDTIFSGIGDDRIDGGNGDDLIKGNDGNDLIKGGNGNDIIYGQNGDDTLLGGGGDDKLVGLDGTDSIEGGDGHDRLYGGVGQDILKGGNGKDSIFQDS